MICEHSVKLKISDLPLESPGVILRPQGPVTIVATPCHFGGRRLWFLCPNCKRRCRDLYPYYCRRCLGLRYRMETEKPQDRYITQAERIRKRLGQRSGGIIPPFPQKPPYMHWKTYLRLKAKCEAYEAAFVREGRKWLGYKD